ncbi:MAG: carbohydrate kinase family protein [Patescibacteria group bacterium]
MNHPVDVLVGFSGNPETIIDHRDTKKGGKPRRLSRIGGTSVNLGIGLSLLGVPTKILITTGSDRGAARVIKGLANSGVPHHTFAVRKRTSRATVTLNDEARTIIGHKGPYHSYPVDRVRREVFQTKPRVRAVTGAQAEEAALIRAMFTRRHNGMTVLNPRPCLIESPGFRKILGLTNFLALNEEEMRLLGQTLLQSNGGGPLPDLVRQIHGFGPDYVLVTLGEQGMCLSVSDGQYLERGIIDSGPAVDQTGAGDSCLAGVLACHLQGGDLRNCLLWGAVTSSLTVSQLGGSAVPDLDEVTRAIHRQPRT